MAETSERDRCRGALVGLAAGDAVGAPVEFQMPGTFTPVTEMIGDTGPHRLPVGFWTDDTSQALCLADSMIFSGWDLKDQMERYCRWWKDGYRSSTDECFDIGVTTQKSLHTFLLTGDPLAGLRDPHGAGNGSLMRLAPVPIVFRRDLDQAEERSRQSAQTTHGSQAAQDATAWYGRLIARVLGGQHPREALGEESGFPTPCEDLSEVISGSYASKHPPEIRGHGYAVASVEASLWALCSTDNFEEAILAATNLGEDSDTTAAICGQLAGAAYGWEAIPKRWRENLLMHAEICEISDKLMQLEL